MPSRIVGFKEELVALTGALAPTLGTAEGLKNYGHTGLLRNRNFVDGISLDMARHGKALAITTAAMTLPSPFSLGHPSFFSHVTVRRFHLPGAHQRCLTTWDSAAGLLTAAPDPRRVREGHPILQTRPRRLPGQVARAAPLSRPELPWVQALRSSFFARFGRMQRSHLPQSMVFLLISK